MITMIIMIIPILTLILSSFNFCIRGGIWWPAFYVTFISGLLFSPWLDPIRCLRPAEKYQEMDFSKFTIANYSAAGGLWGNQFILGQIKKLSSKLVFIPRRRHQNTIIARHATFQQNQNSQLLAFKKNIHLLILLHREKFQLFKIYQEYLYTQAEPS